MDFFFIRGVGGKKEPYLINVDEATGHVTTVKCASRKLDAAVEAVLRVQASYKAYGHTLSSVRSDRESAFIAMAPHLGDAGIVVDRTSSGRHSNVAERYIHTIKDHMCVLCVQVCPTDCLFISFNT